MKGLEGKLAIITGGARGIGFATAKILAEHKTNVILADINGDLANESAEKLKELGVESYGWQLDVSSVAAIKDFFAQIKEKFGSVDILVNNAGIQIRHPSIEFPEEDWDKLMNINLKAVFYCSQEYAAMMQDKGGTIVNISSGTSTQTTPGRAPYVISKAGVNAMTAVLASEWAKYGIRVNAIAPGWIMTEMVKDGMRLGIVSEKQLMAAIPFKRLADTEEIAEAVVYLASESASYITGQTLFVDGGWSALGLPQDV